MGKPRVPVGTRVKYVGPVLTDHGREGVVIEPTGHTHRDYTRVRWDDVKSSRPNSGDRVRTDALKVLK